MYVISVLCWQRVLRDLDEWYGGHYFFLMLRRPPRSTLFPSTTIFRSSIPVPNPMETAKLQARETFQVNHEEFILQFFFNGRDIFGYILKRNKSRPIHFRWCFFRNCEESPYDFNKVIAEAFNPPYDSDFFSIKFPSYLNYSFQGMMFSSPK